MTRTDPFTPESKTYECPGCGHRSSGGDSPACPDCGGTMRNIAVPRE